MERGGGHRNLESGARSGCRGSLGAGRRAGGASVHILVHWFGALYVNVTLYTLYPNDLDSPFKCSGNPEGPFAKPGLPATTSKPVSSTCLLEDLEALRYVVHLTIRPHKTQWKGDFGPKTVTTWLDTNVWWCKLPYEPGMCVPLFVAVV